MQKPLFVICLLFLFLSAPLSANDDALDRLPAIIEKGMADWHVPGMAVAVLTDREILFQRGFGTTASTGDKKIDTHTQFAIASTTKAMIAACIMILADEGKLALDDLAIKHLPELQFGDTWLNGQVTVRDMLTHRTGLASTDLWTFVQDMPLDEQIERLSLIEPSASLRSRFQYQNTMFELLGLILERVSGQSWPDFVRERLWQPLGMDETFASRGRITSGKDHVLPYYYLHGEWVQAEWNFDVDFVDAAGSVWSSVHDMGRWAQFLLRDGTTQDGRRLIGKENFAEIFQPQMLVSGEAFYPTIELTRPHWMSYGLGWFQQDFQGRKIDFHTGSLAGLIAMIGLDRENHLAVVILGNRDHAEMRHAILWEVMDQQPVDSRRDWSADILALYRGLDEKHKAEWEKTVSGRLTGTRPALPLADYLGLYHNAGWGSVEVQQTAKGMLFHSVKVDLALTHWHHDTFLAERNGEDFRVLIPFKLSRHGTVQSLEMFGYTFDRVTDVAE